MNIQMKEALEEAKKNLETSLLMEGVEYKDRLMKFFKDESEFFNYREDFLIEKKLSIMKMGLKKYLQQNFNSRDFDRLNYEEYKKRFLIVLNEYEDSWSILSEVDDKFKADKDIMLEAVRKNGSSFLLASDELREDKDFTIEILMLDGENVKYISESCKKDVDKMLEIFEELPLENVCNAISEIKRTFDFYEMIGHDYNKEDVSKYTKFLVDKFSEYEISKDYDLDALSKDDGFKILETLESLRVDRKLELGPKKPEFVDSNEKKDSGMEF